MDVLRVIEVMEEEGRQRVPRIFRDRTKPYETLSHEEFRKDYRFTRKAFFKICGLLEQDLLHPTSRKSDLPVADQVAMSIHLLGRNVMQADSARIAGCNQATVARTLNFLQAINKHACDYIYWPSERERRELRRIYYEKYRLPEVVGAIDGTHIPIQAPHLNKEDYKGGA
ncbi:hypothetical protein ANCDUO_11307 [Ancylostoma duodenale]|uniref:Nuclease HARBI1 n=1 Tax=Ancylostoma duodenale TaxID=51022 RepID=A0A0C2D8K0_9BILA|nr:hypothetical protein ANCDUO_11307 [Ancylostoma duodenale]